MLFKNIIAISVLFSSLFRDAMFCGHKRVTCINKYTYQFCFRYKSKLFKISNKKYCPAGTLCHESHGKYACIYDLATLLNEANASSTESQMKNTTTNHNNNDNVSIHHTLQHKISEVETTSEFPNSYFQSTVPDTPNFISTNSSELPTIYSAIENPTSFNTYPTLQTEEILTNDVPLMGGTIGTTSLPNTSKVTRISKRTTLTTEYLPATTPSRSTLKVTRFKKRKHSTKRNSTEIPSTQRNNWRDKNTNSLRKTTIDGSSKRVSTAGSTVKTLNTAQPGKIPPTRRKNVHHKNTTNFRKTTKQDSSTSVSTDDSAEFSTIKTLITTQPATTHSTSTLKVTRTKKRKNSTKRNSLEITPSTLRNNYYDKTTFPKTTIHDSSESVSTDVSTKFTTIKALNTKHSDPTPVVSSVYSTTSRPHVGYFLINIDHKVINEFNMPNVQTAGTLSPQLKDDVKSTNTEVTATDTLRTTIKVDLAITKPVTCPGPQKYPSSKCNEYYECVRALWWYMPVTKYCSDGEKFDVSILNCVFDDSCKTT